MEIILPIAGTIFGIFGILLIIAPKVLIKAGELMNRSVSIDEKIFSRRILVGAMLIVGGLFLFYTLYIQ